MADNLQFKKFEETIVGRSPQIKKVLETAKKIARSSFITTLIVGESGTGKELVARLIHNLSTTGNQPFVDINCGAIPESLLESELFGYEKGAFTDAKVRKLGLFELAQGGTIFLDEIGNTSLKLQMKLLKVVEHKTFRRIGGVEEIRVATRIIAATNFDLEEAVKQGTFREDLYYRLNVFQIKVPPLRDRGNDVLLLAEHFIKEFNAEYNRNVQGLSPAAQKLLLSYHWPGNVRQLKNALERAMLVESDEIIEAEHLALNNERNREPLNNVPKDKLQILDNGELHFEIPAEGIPLDEIERAVVLSALRKADGNLSKAARLLHIRRSKLRYRVEKLGVSPHLLRAAKSSR